MFWYGKVPIYQFSVWSKGSFIDKKIGDLPEDLQIEVVLESNGFVFDSNKVAEVVSSDVHYSLGYGEIRLPHKMNYFTTNTNEVKFVCLSKTDTLS